MRKNRSRIMVGDRLTFTVPGALEVDGKLMRKTNMFLYVLVYNVTYDVTNFITDGYVVAVPVGVVIVHSRIRALQ